MNLPACLILESEQMELMKFRLALFFIILLCIAPLKFYEVPSHGSESALIIGELTLEHAGNSVHKFSFQNFFLEYFLAFALIMVYAISVMT